MLRLSSVKKKKGTEKWDIRLGKKRKYNQESPCSCPCVRKLQSVWQCQNSPAHGHDLQKLEMTKDTQ